jgi:hypothetical protein
VALFLSAYSYGLDIAVRHIAHAAEQALMEIFMLLFGLIWMRVLSVCCQRMNRTSHIFHVRGTKTLTLKH